MIHWSDRIAKRLKEKGWTAAELIRQSGVSRDLVYKYMQGQVENPRGDILSLLGKPLGMSEMEIRYGLSEVVATKRIPLLSMNKLGTLKPGMSIESVWDGESMVVVPGDVGQSAVGVVLSDDSGGREFPNGDTVIFDPAQTPAPGRYVVAVVLDTEQAVFRRYRPLDARDLMAFSLHAANPDYPEIRSTAEYPVLILGRAVKHIRDL